ncbi:MAG: metallophosphoesterase [Phycisphaeraceae bacterium]|nr:metallophosphoesterase [Phycisphaeraceae bacterium]
MPIAASLAHYIDLSLPHLPHALEGFRIAHVSDLHVSRPRRRHQHLAWLLASLRLDMIVLTGDYMDDPPDEDQAFSVLESICRQARPAQGIFGVFGNHDEPAFRARCQTLSVRWLSNGYHRFPNLPLEILGLDLDIYSHSDLTAALLDWPAEPFTIAARKNAERPLRLFLTHLPTYLPVASDLDVDLMLAGHTHGGQFRLWPGRPIVNSTDMPAHLTSGLLRHRNTLCAVSRGLGEAGIPFRTFCPPHLPIYTLRRRTMPNRYSQTIENIQPW